MASNTTRHPVVAPGRNNWRGAEAGEEEDGSVDTRKGHAPTAAQGRRDRSQGLGRYHKPFAGRRYPAAGGRMHGRMVRLGVRIFQAGLSAGRQRRAQYPGDSDATLARPAADDGFPAYIVAEAARLSYEKRSHRRDENALARVPALTTWTGGAAGQAGRRGSIRAFPKLSRRWYIWFPVGGAGVGPLVFGRRRD